MKAAGCRSDENAAASAATTILIAVMLGCLAISAQCGRVPTDLAGERGEVAAAGSASSEDPAAMAQPICYKACDNGRCEYCCASAYRPTFCWTKEDQCWRTCAISPVRRAVPRPTSDGNSGIVNERP